jgi:hypothetical protein
MEKVTPEQALKALDGLMGGLREAGTDGWYWLDEATIRRFIEESKASKDVKESQ